MTGAPAVSVVIVSRHRPEALRRCLIGVSQLRYEPYEVVIVADPAGCSALRALPQAAHVKLIAFDEANISAARNLGVEAAAGEVVAFIDDDAVPEPTWLSFLCAPFAHSGVAAAGGFVRGRNGISWQSRAQSVDRMARTAPIAVDPDRATLLTPTPERAIKTEGTNMALRRGCLAQMGGFDPRYRFFLDETDLNLRLARQGLRTAIVPRAQVHHGFAASGRRRADRTPTDLYEIGASWAVFLHSHCDPTLRESAWAQARNAQRRRCLRCLVSGALEPRDLRWLMQRLQAGFSDGLTRSQAPLPVLAQPAMPFRPYPGGAGAKSVLISGRSWSRRRLRRQARAEALAGNVATVFRLSPTALYHRVVFSSDGYWEQTGGLFGKSERQQRLCAFWTFRERIRAEARRMSVVRGVESFVCQTAHLSKKPGI